MNSLSVAPDRKKGGIRPTNDFIDWIVSIVRNDYLGYGWNRAIGSIGEWGILAWIYHVADISTKRGIMTDQAGTRLVISIDYDRFREELGPLRNNHTQSAFQLYKDRSLKVRAWYYALIAIPEQEHESQEFRDTVDNIPDDLLIDVLTRYMAA